MRHWMVPALALGATVSALAVVFTANLLIGLEANNVLGWAFSAFALYADIALAMFLVAAWPILVDPVREIEPLGTRLRLAALLGLARAGRVFALTAIIGAVLIISTIFFAALMTISVAYAGMVAARYVLAAADRLEGRRTRLAVDD